ncbi:sialidase-4 isoform X1 [Paramormyrops kingsleyae]|uniref:sialidase-4 isoform X1 n=1 Tax=Paramormyrops kingsleyae TaxID=1676925 RepID=UPI003B977927
MGSPNFPTRTVLFQKEPNGVTYRVPALLYLPSPPCLLAFCEQRVTPADTQAKLLVLRRGTFYPNGVEWEDMTVLDSAQLEGCRSMNPCPVYDRFTGTVFLFFIAVLGDTSESLQLITGKNVTRLCCVSSQDRGKTWSSVMDMTLAVIGDAIKDWATFALGPGHGIQLRSGRLLVPAYAYHIGRRRRFGQPCETTPRSFCLHSDTHGRSWCRGEAVPSLESVECQVVSVDQQDGGDVLYCNARSPLGFRVQALSLDGGIVFRDSQLVPKLIEPPHGCHGSVVGFPAPISQPGKSKEASSYGQNLLTPTWVVYSHPTWPSGRQDLGVHLSPFPRDPDSWSPPWVIYQGPSAYSDLAYLEPAAPASPLAGAFACVFESGSLTPYDQISFCVFTLHELFNNIPEHKPAQSRNSRLCGLCSIS